MPAHPIACRRAALPLTSSAPQHIWVSDELLIYTFQRFLRAQGHRIRHGSNVPGPLEARRRGLKRRMTAAASIQGSPPPPPIFGALFGFRSSSPEQRVRYEPPSIGISRELPKHPPKPPQPPPISSVGDVLRPQHSPAPRHQSPPVYRTSRKQNNQLAQESAPSSPEQSPAALYQYPPMRLISREPKKKPNHSLENPNRRPVNESTAYTNAIGAFRSSVDKWTTYKDAIKLFKTMSLLKKPKEKPLSPVKVESPVASAIAHLRRFWNLEEILRFLSDKNVPLPPLGSKDAENLISKVLDMPIKGNLSEISAWYKTFVSRFLDQDKENTESLADDSYILRRQWNASLLGLSKRILDSLEGDRLHKSRFPLKTHFVVKTLICFRYLPQVKLPQLVADVISMEVKNSSADSKANNKGSGLASILSAIPPSILKQVLLLVTSELLKQPKPKPASSQTPAKVCIQRWLSVVTAMNGQTDSTSTSRDLSMIYDLLAQAYRPDSYLGEYLTKVDPYVFVNVLLDWICGHPSLPPSQVQQAEACLQKYRGGLAKDCNRNLSLTELLAELFAQTSQFAIRNDKFFEFTVEFLYKYKPPDMIISFLQKLEAKGGTITNPEYLHKFMLRLLDERKQIAFHICRSISALEQYPNARFPIDPILLALESRHKFHDIIDNAEALRTLPAGLEDQPIDELQKSHTVLIHHIAYQYSLDHNYSCQEVQRHTLPLYRYLRDHDLPIGPLFTRAMVRIWIARPLSERRWVPLKRVIGMCQIISKVEGEEEARRVMSTFLQWRGDLILYAARRWAEADGGGLAQVNSCRRLGLLDQ